MWKLCPGCSDAWIATRYRVPFELAKGPVSYEIRFGAHGELGMGF